MAVAAELGLPIVETARLELEEGEEPPRPCTQDSFRVQLPEPVAKLNQAYYWGGPDWYPQYGRRSYVEGVFGNLKNPRTENLKRGTIQKTGLTWSQLMVTLICATYNVRIIRERHARMGLAWKGHPLLTPDAETTTHVSLSPEDERRLCEAYFNNVDLERLEIHPPAPHEVVPEIPPTNDSGGPRARTRMPFWLSSSSRGATVASVSSC
jgi:hypothetical protein